MRLLVPLLVVVVLVWIFVPPPGRGPGLDGVAEAMPTITPLPAATTTEQLLQQFRCPVDRPGVVMTQGYGIGSHAPAEIWGAVDLAIKGPSGAAEPGPSWDAPIVAALPGTVDVTLDSYPAGNHVWVNHPDGSRTGYAHLNAVFVVDGQEVQAGEQLGALGSTGASSGPHLDFQYWQGGPNFFNVDPTSLVATACGL